jgi:nitroimidazol reductase NimA-like FMN-containing flavoprotein (pyridoxamine 5'-phosphate oxidase superfamily)
MTDNKPVTAQPYYADGPSPVPWSEARGRLAEANGYWLATTRGDGRPHLVPVLAVWTDGALHFAASPASRKAKNLARDPHLAVTTSHQGLDVVVEGTARKVTDEARLRRVAEGYASKYDWRVAVREGAFHDTEGAPTAGPPPYEVYEVVPMTGFGLPVSEGFAPTRWIVGA